MAYLGDKLQSEAVRFHLTLDAAPTGTPTITITRGQGTALDTPISTVNMTQGADTLEWYYDYTTEAAAQIGLYAAKFIAVIDSVTRYAYDQYDVTVADADSVEAKVDIVDTNVDTALVNQATIEGKIDTVDTVVDSIQTDTTSIESKVDILDTNVDTSLVNQTNMETKIDTIDTVVDSIQTDTTSIETKVDTAITDIAAVPTVGEIDTELTSEHGAGPWTTGTTGTGLKAITINIKDGDTNNLEGVNVDIHNAANDESPQYASGQTDTDGNTPEFNLDAATYKVRLAKAGAIVSETETIIVTEDDTFDLTVVAQTVSNPSDPDVCRLRLYPITLGDEDITDLADNIIISCRDSLTKVSGQYIKNTEASFTYDSATEPDSYYFDAVRGSIVHVKCDVLGLDHSFTVPDQETEDISNLQT